VVSILVAWTAAWEKQKVAEIDVQVQEGDRGTPQSTSCRFEETRSEEVEIKHAVGPSAEIYPTFTPIGRPRVIVGVATADRLECSLRLPR
jgi:hypothetical protein